MGEKLVYLYLFLAEKTRFMPKLTHNPLSKLKNMLTSQDQEKKDDPPATASANDEKPESKEQEDVK